MADLFGFEKYLLDTNIYIDCYERRYRFQTFPSFWEKFEPVTQHIVLPTIVLEEANKNKEFAQWIKAHFKGEILENHKQYANDWAKVIQHIATEPHYNEKALTSNDSWTYEKVAEPWLIAIAQCKNLILVSNETPNPNLSSKNPNKAPRIPDVAKAFQVDCITLNDFFDKVKLTI